MLFLISVSKFTTSFSLNLRMHVFSQVQFSTNNFQYKFKLKKKITKYIYPSILYYFFNFKRNNGVIFDQKHKFNFEFLILFYAYRNINNSKMYSKNILNNYIFMKIWSLCHPLSLKQVDGKKFFYLYFADGFVHNLITLENYKSFVNNRELTSEESILRDNERLKKVHSFFLTSFKSKKSMLLIHYFQDSEIFLKKLCYYFCNNYLSQNNILLNQKKLENSVNLYDNLTNLEIQDLFLNNKSMLGFFLGKFIYWQMVNRIYFLNRNFMSMLKYEFTSINKKISFYNITKYSNITKVNKKLLKKKNSKMYLYNDLKSYLVGNSYKKLTSNFKNQLTFYNTPFFKNIGQKIYKINNLKKKININKVILDLTSFFIKFKKIQWPSIIKIIKMKRRNKFFSLLSLFGILKKTKVNSNKHAEIYFKLKITNQFLLKFINVAVCILSEKHVTFFLTVTTTRGYVIYRKSQGQFLSNKPRSFYIEKTFAEFVGRNFATTCFVLNFGTLFFFLKNGLGNSRLYGIFTSIVQTSIYMRKRIYLKGIIIGRSIPHSLPMRFKKKRRK